MEDVLNNSEKLCIGCKHYTGNFTCIHFPEGIPEDLLTGNCDRWEEEIEPEEGI
jgi:hypothetical protein